MRIILSQSEVRVNHKEINRLNESAWLLLDLCRHVIFDAFIKLSSHPNEWKVANMFSFLLPYLPKNWCRYYYYGKISGMMALC